MTRTDDGKLANCPFCGSYASTEKYTKSGKWFVECMDRYGSCFRPITSSFDSEAGAIAAWNTRAHQQASLPVEATSEDADYFRICALEAQLRSAVGVLRSVKECRPQLMPSTINGAIDDIEKLLPSPPEPLMPKEAKS